MKLSKLLLAIFLLSPALVFGQAFGLKSGINLSTLSKGFDFKDTKSKIGFYGGAFANFQLFNKFDFQPEILYDGLGAKVIYSGNGTAPGSEFDRRLNYISVPLMLQYKIIHSVYLGIGPQFSFLINGKESYTGLNGQEVTENIPGDFLNKFDFGIGIGAGYYFLKNIGINFRYVAGLTDIYKHNDKKSIKNSSFQIGLAYQFR